MLLLFHNGGVLFSLGFTILMCVVLVVVFNVLASRKIRLAIGGFAESVA
jgi:hypothetical protein